MLAGSATNDGEAMKSKLNYVMLAIGSVLCVGLAGCGGGGGSGGAGGASSSVGGASGTLSVNIDGGPFSAVAGNSLQIVANANTQTSLIQTMSWKITAEDPTAPALVTGNADCSGATKNSSPLPANGQTATGSSQWSCALAVSASTKLVNNAVYDLSVTVTDDRKLSTTATTKVTYNVSGSGSGTPGGLTANAGLAYTVNPGATAPLLCQATGGTAPYSYVWSIINNAGLPLALSTYSAGQTSFVAPAVSQSTSFGFQCVVTDANNSTSKSTVTVTDLPSNTNSPLIAFAGGNYTIAPSSSAPLSCSAAGGTAPYSYSWVITDNASLPISLGSYSAAQTSFTAPGVTAPTPITLTCKVTDASNNTSSSNIIVTDSPVGSTKALTASTGLGYTLSPGATGNLQCGATGGVPSAAGYNYQWSVTANGGLNIPLSSYNAPSVTFTAPNVTTSTNLTFQCTVTDFASNLATSSVTVTDSASSASTNNLVASAGQGASVNPGQTATLNGSSTGWFDSTGKSVTGPTITYAWTSNNPSVVITNPSSATTTFTAPTGITSPTQVEFTLTTSSAGGASSVANVTFLVDPFAPFTLVVNPPAQAVSLGTVASFVAAGTSTNTTPTLYYNWTSVSGPATPVMGGQQTSTMGFVPTVAGVYVFQVAVGYQPITASYPGIYFANATVTAK